VAKLQTGGGCSLMYEVAHSMIYMRMHEMCGDLVKSGVTKFCKVRGDERRRLCVLGGHSGDS
jgi:hypothetical protein